MELLRALAFLAVLMRAASVGSTVRVEIKGPEKTAALQ
jgi:phosphotransferase system HPr-like phosphotransfer protein